MTGKTPNWCDYPLVWIDWLDSTGGGGWRSIEGLGRAMLECRSVGFLVHEDDESVTVSASLASLGNADEPIRIPKVSITGRWEIEVT